ncbi:MAG: superoxide dismutase family protein, partial [Actinomycetota bacterium]|nr:superoxide dismutase family protein [Actinomycetota bacterium]
MTLAGCGGGPAGRTHNGHADHGGNADHAGPAGHGVVLGDPNAVPAAEVPNAELVGGEFRVLDTAPEGYQNVKGFAQLARHAGGTTVTVELAGLKPRTEIIAHVHEGSCAEGGGQHYRFDPQGADVPPNEIHLLVTSDESGAGRMTVENKRRAGAAARSIVVHPVEFQDNRITCAPL